MQRAFVAAAASEKRTGAGGVLDRSAEAAANADTPLLTGDPEWDAVELAATDESSEPFDASFLAGIV